ncbi:response regulator [Pleionea sediminis]|uniref:response regulator n=1 Tax=Pleionea sediminis TaxID=2569479 RepID=UPI001185EC33|nr:response regulator transcription factor [Pleionea sediminis]
MISVLSIDDHAIVRQGIVSFVNSQDDMEVVADSGDPEEGLRLIEQTAPDVILMDLKLNHDIDGIEATRRAKILSPRSQVVVLTSYHQDEHIFPAIEAGALSYLLKDTDPEALADAIRKAFKRQAVLSPFVAERILKETETKGLESHRVSVQLSHRELEVLRLLASGYSNQEISDQLGIAIKTVRCHVSNILSKLHLRDRTQAAVTAWQQGIMD